VLCVVVVARPLGRPQPGTWFLGMALPSDLSPALIGRERGLALAGRASRQNSATAEAACKQGRIRPSIQSALAQWDKSLGVRSRPNRFHCRFAGQVRPPEPDVHRRPHPPDLVELQVSGDRAAACRDPGCPLPGQCASNVAAAEAAAAAADADAAMTTATMTTMIMMLRVRGEIMRLIIRRTD
jgi:hypothetical protein